MIPVGSSTKLSSRVDADLIAGSVSAIDLVSQRRSFDVCLVIYDEEHSDDEDHFLVIGPIARGLVVVAHTEPSEDVVRIVSARMATRPEAELFHERAGGRKR